jgi:hypothetical protein
MKAVSSLYEGSFRSGCMPENGDGVFLRRDEMRAVSDRDDTKHAQNY